MEDLIFIFIFIGLALSIYSLNKSRNLYKSFYMAVNEKELLKKYNDLMKRRNLEKDKKAKKILDKEIKNFNDSYLIDDFEVGYLKLDKNEKSIKLAMDFLNQLNKSFIVGVWGLILLFITIIYFQIKTLTNPTGARILGVSLLFLMVLFVFLSIKFDHKKRLVKTLIICTCIIYLASVYLMGCGADLF
jgi:hypothetical protein